MAIKALFLIVTVGTSIWVAFDAPRRGLTRLWALGCLVVWVVAFPLYLIERGMVDRWLGEPAGAGAGRRARRGPSRISIRRRRAIAVVLAFALPLAAWEAWELRLVFRDPYMVFFVRHPALSSIPLLAGGMAFLAHLLVKLAQRKLRGPSPGRTPQTTERNGSPRSRGRSRKRRAQVAAGEQPRERDGGRRTDRSSRYSLAEFARGGWRGRGERPPPFLLGPALSFAAFGTLGFLLAAAMTSAWTDAALYRHTDYDALTLDMLRGGNVRIKPYEVAQRQTENGLNSPTERPTNLHIVKDEGRLVWTSVRDPEGFFRVLTQPTKGVISVDGNSSAPGVKQSGPRYDSDFRYGPGMRISQNIRWQVYKKKCYSCDLAEMTGLPTPRGPVVIAPYIRYEGNWLVRRPVFGGVYLVHPDGRIDDLSPEQAARHPLLLGAGRVFPETLARRIAEAYKYKRGVWNAIFVHTDQLEVADTERNSQPFLQDFEGLGPQWVTTLKPRGRTFTTAGLMTIDALTGKTRLWTTRPSQSLIGNQRSLDIVRGESFPGITFTQAGSSDAGGKFRVVEPRQVFPGGRLQFLLSIIPNAANRVTMSVIVDADSQRVVAKFAATPAGDADLIAYLRTAQLPTEANTENTAPDAGGPAGEGTDPSSTLRRLLRENRAEQSRAAGRISSLKAQERDLLRLLEAAEKRR